MTDIKTLTVHAAEPASRPYDVIVIGSGMSGLVSAVILAKEGKRVVVLEQHYRPGGYLHRFYRKNGVEFDVGFHYVGGIEKGQVLGAYLDYCGVRDRLKLIPLDPDGYDDLRFPGVRFLIPAGEERFKARLCAMFPNEREAIDTYFRDVRAICDGFAFYRLRVEQDLGHADRWMSISLEDYLSRMTQDRRLWAILGAQNPLYGTAPRRAPMGLHALVSDSFMQNPYSIDGGGAAIVAAMVDRIRELGGEVRTRKRVTDIFVDDQTEVTGVRTADGEEYRAPLIVTSAHPKNVVRMLPEHVLRPGFRRRVLGMEDGPSTLGVFATTKADLSAYGRRNYYNYHALDLNEPYGNVDRPNDFVFITVPSAREGKTPGGLHTLTGLGFCDWRRVARWADTRTGERGPEYEAFKQERALDMMRLVYEVVPELKGQIETFEAATPLTNRDYAASEAGAAYGIHHTVEQSGRYGLRPRTRVGGLWMAGQSVLMPGVCGVTISAFHTCSLIVGAEYLMRKVHAAAA